MDCDASSFLAHWLEHDYLLSFWAFLVLTSVSSLVVMPLRKVPARFLQLFFYPQVPQVARVCSVLSFGRSILEPWPGSSGLVPSHLQVAAGLLEASCVGAGRGRLRFISVHGRLRRQVSSEAAEVSIPAWSSELLVELHLDFFVE